MNKIFVISDTHFSHPNIIKYQKRPFKDVNEMNQILLNNWNSIVSKNDTVYFLGDLCMRDSPEYWLNLLNGNKILIRGNHDKHLTSASKYLIINHNDEKLLLTHDPESLQFEWNGWIIHGHHHNNRPFGYPLIHKKKKTMNVSVELIDYKPVEINTLLKMRL